MAEETKVEISIEANAKTGAITAAGSEVEGLDAKLKGAQESAKGTAEGMGALEEATDALTDKLAQLASAAAIGAFFKQAVEESLKEAEALRVLKGSVESTGASWGVYKDQIEQFAAAQQAATRFDDTVTYEVLGRLALATRSVGEAMRATRLAQDLSVQSGKTLSETTDIVNNLLLGQERAVKMATKELGNYAGGATTAQGVLDNLERSVKGAAAAEESFTKSLAQNKNFLADFEQRIGDGIVPILSVLSTALAFVAKGYEQLGVTVAGVMAAAASVTMTQAAVMNAALHGHFREALRLAGQGKEELKTIAEETAKDISAIEERFKGKAASEGGNADRLKARESVEAAAQAAQEKADLEKKLSDEILQLTDNEFDYKRAKVEEELAQAERLGIDKTTIEAARELQLESIMKQETAAKAKEIKAQAALDEQKKKDFASTLQFISTLSTAKNKELALIGKAAGIANAYINTSVAVTRALAAAPPPFNFVLAAAVGAAGAAQIATIAGVQLEKGGLVPGSAGGTDATIGEKGKPEAVLPLTDARAMAAVGKAIADAGGSGGSGTTVINITVNASLEWRDMANKIAEEASSGSPEIIRLARRLGDLNELYARRAS